MGEGEGLNRRQFPGLHLCFPLLGRRGAHAGVLYLFCDPFFFGFRGGRGRGRERYFFCFVSPMFEVSENKPAMVQLLIRKGAKVDDENDKGQTALCEAVHSRGI